MRIHSDHAQNGGFRGVAIRVAAGVAVAALAGLSVAPSAAVACTTGKPVPLKETWTPASFTVNKAKFTIWTGPVDHGSQLQITSGIGKSLWVAMSGNASILKLSLKGAAEIYATPTGNSSPEAIAQNGKDMWFTEWNTTCVGSVTGKGAIAEYPNNFANNPINQSTGMATGLGGTTWFVTDYNGIGRITSKGVVTQFPIENDSTQPTAITLGPDGNMWYVEIAGSNVGKITPSGVVTAYNAGFNSGSGGFGIAAGADGRIWFVDPGNNPPRIGAINTDGSGLTYYNLSSGGLPASITAGPDGSLYFGEYGAAVGRITTAGMITEYAIVASEGSFPVISLTTGPDKNIWFSNNNHSQVGELKLPIK